MEVEVPGNPIFINDNLSETLVLTGTYTNKFNKHIFGVQRFKKSKRKVQRMPQSQTAALPRHQEEEETDKTNKRKSNRCTKSSKISSLFPQQGNRNTTNSLVE